MLGDKNKSGFGVENALSDGRDYTYPGDFGASYQSSLEWDCIICWKKNRSGYLAVGMLALVIVQYGMMTGGSVSTMRAVCMFLLSVGAKIRQDSL